jgi:hypothetical protein
MAAHNGTYVRLIGCHEPHIMPVMGGQMSDDLTCVSASWRPDWNGRGVLSLQSTL